MATTNGELEKRFWAAADRLWANASLKPSEAISVNGKTLPQAMGGFRNNTRASRVASDVTLGHEPVATLIHSRSHRFLTTTPATVMKFFKEHAKL